MTTTRIRRATPADAEPLARVHVETWRAAYRHVFGDALSELDVAERAALWRDILASPDNWPTHVAESDGHIVGFSGAGPCRDEDVGPETAELYAVYVLPEHWGSRHGKDLLAAAEEDMRQRGYQRAVLWVLEDNPRARRFYEREGWAPDGSRHEFERFGITTHVVRYAKQLA